MIVSSTRQDFTLKASITDLQVTSAANKLEISFANLCLLTKKYSESLKLIGCVYHHTSGVELKFPNDIQGDFADDKVKAVLIRGVTNAFLLFLRVLIVGIETCF